MNSDLEEAPPNLEAQPDAVLLTADVEKPAVDLYARTLLSIETSDLEAMRERAGDLLAQIMEEGP